MRSLRSSSGQAILELAIFGTIALFCLGFLLQYGLSQNYQQSLQMVTWRRALSLALNRRNRVPEVTLTVVNDKSIPDPLDAYGLHQSTPVAASFTAAYSNYMFTEPEDAQGLPGTDFVINEAWIEPGAPKHARLPDNRPIDDTRGVFHASGYWETEANPCDIPPHSTKYCGEALYCMRRPRKSGMGVWQKWVAIKNQAYSDPEVYGGDIPACGSLGQGSSLDVDDDGIEETIKKKKIVTGLVDEWGNSTEPTKEYWMLLDPKAGDLNLQDKQYENKEIEVGGEKRTVRIERSQGLQPEYTKGLMINEGSFDGRDYSGTMLKRLEDQKGIMTMDKVEGSEVITRKIKLNPRNWNNTTQEVESVLPRDRQRASRTPF